MKKFKEFETLTKKIYEHLVDKSSVIKHDVKLQGKDGERQIDVLIDGMLGPHQVRTIIECKDYKGKVDVSKIDALHSKMQDVNAHVAILVSAKGFSGTAIKKAKRLGIKLCTINEALSDKWSIEIDLPILIKEITPKLNVHFSANLEAGQTFSTDLILNDINVHQAFVTLWEQQYLKITPQTNILPLLGINNPIFIREIKTRKIVSINDVKVNFSLDTNFYFGNLRSLKDTLLLNNISEDSTSIIFKSEQLGAYKNIFAHYNNEENIPNRKTILVNCNAYPIISNSKTELIINEIKTY